MRRRERERWEPCPAVGSLRQLADPSDSERALRIASLGSGKQVREPPGDLFVFDDRGRQYALGEFPLLPQELIEHLVERLGAFEYRNGRDNFDGPGLPQSPGPSDHLRLDGRVERPLQ